MVQHDSPKRILTYRLLVYIIQTNVNSVTFTD